ncbi:MAG: penicillin-binding protein [Actinomycetota bacterium]|nr:penicillin-binding protein [Actinomycetota bacterium]
MSDRRDNSGQDPSALSGSSSAKSSPERFPESRLAQRHPPDGVAWSFRLWRLRTIVLMALLVSVLTLLGTLFIGWLVFPVPSPAVLAAARKQVTTIVASDGKTEVGRYVPDEGNRIVVSLSQVPVHVQNAVLAAEDRSFRSNPGFDIGAIARAMGDQLTGGSGGGSTITQQYIKVVTGHDEYSLLRKFREVVVAAKITKRESKDQILQDYLNTIYFGRGAYGIQAASQAYFGKNVQNLTVSEAALLAGLIQSPSQLDPASDLAAAQARWDFVLNGMVEQGWLSSADRAVQQYPTTLALGQASQALSAPTDDRAHIVDRVLEELASQGITRAQVATGGGRILTTIDPRVQQLARDAVRAQLRGQPGNVHSSLVAVDPRTGAVIAYYGGSDGTGFDLAGGLPWSPGSAFKPFTMLAALERGIGMYSMYDGQSPLMIAGHRYANSESQNFPKLTLKQAMTQSVNTAFVRLARDVGAESVRSAAIQAGIPEEINGKRALAEPDSGEPGIGITLGQYPVRTIDMASAYATFAADGVRHEPFFVREYDNSFGDVKYHHLDKPQPAFDAADPVHNAQLARNVTATLTDVARSSQIPLTGGRQVAAKTGTHQLGDTGHNSAAWTIGYTPSISTAVWVGDPANSAIKNANGADIFGRGLPGAIWQRFMNSSLQGTPREVFPPLERIGPPPPTTRFPAERTHQRRNANPFAPPRPGFPGADPFAPPQSDFPDTEPAPGRPSTKPARPQRSDCYPYCWEAPTPENADPGGAPHF